MPEGPLPGPPRLPNRPWQPRDDGALNAVAFAPAGDLVAAGSGDALVLLWDAGFVRGAHAGAAAPGSERLASTCRTRRQKLQSVP